MQIEIYEHIISKGIITVSYYDGEDKELSFDYDLLIKHVVDEGLIFGLKMVGRPEDSDVDFEDVWIDPIVWTEENTNEALISYLNNLKG